MNRTSSYKPPSPTKLKLQEIENKAKILLQHAKTEEERKSIEDRLEAVRLRAKYAYY